jgi:hypothetical protein
VKKVGNKEKKVKIIKRAVPKMLSGQPQDSLTENFRGYQ